MSNVNIVTEKCIPTVGIKLEQGFKYEVSQWN